MKDRKTKSVHGHLTCIHKIIPCYRIVLYANTRDKLLSLPVLIKTVDHLAADGSSTLPHPCRLHLLQTVFPDKKVFKKIPVLRTGSRRSWQGQDPNLKDMLHLLQHVS